MLSFTCYVQAVDFLDGAVAPAVVERLEDAILIRAGQIQININTFCLIERKSDFVQKLVFKLFTFVWTFLVREIRLPRLG